MANQTYKVIWGDTLSEIALKYNTTVSNLVKLNNIKDPDFIVEGQTLIISGTAAEETSNYSNKATIKVFGRQSGTDRTFYATWTWDKSNTENYEVKWTYATGDGIAFIGNKSTTEDKQSLYTAPENATKVAFVVKPISEKKTVNNKQTSYWTASWSTKVEYNLKDLPPSEPSVPSVEIKDNTLTASLANLDVNGTHIQFQVVKNDSKVFASGKAAIKTTSASYSCKVDAGAEYKVRCRAVRDNQYSEWTDYSANVGTAPAAPKEITNLRAISKNAVYVDWSKVSTATSYEIEYAKEKRWFDSSSNTQSITIDSVVTHAEITGIETGTEWFFRLRAINDKGNSPWTALKSIKMGTAPAAPTTWSSTNTVITGDDLNLYWVHNSEDGSSQTYAQLELTIGGTSTIYEIQNSTDEDEKDKTSVYLLRTSGYTEGTKIQWRVKTRGVIDTYSDWSIQRTVDVYAPPTLTLSVTDVTTNEVEELTSLPLYISAEAGPQTQTPIGYNVSVVANESYETTDNVGNPVVVSQGEEVYSRYYDISEHLLMELTAGSISLENNISYTIICTVSMDSGLTAEVTHDFMVAWEDEEYNPNAEIIYDPATFSTYVRPYCESGTGVLIEGVSLAVYRREYDGTFTELAKGLSNANNTFITDPHPSLDYARYRVVAVDDATSKVSYYDVPGYAIGEKSVVIQWNEDWSSFDVTNDDLGDEIEQPAWSGSLLSLPYNIDVSDKQNPDVALIEYIGRNHPVSYYGTQLGTTATWNMVIDKEDKETLYGLRRLAIWMGDVYVREPSGSGYWANISVSFSQKHLEVTIPVTLDITRVTGGV